MSRVKIINCYFLECIKKFFKFNGEKIIRFKFCQFRSDYLIYNDINEYNLYLMLFELDFFDLF